MANVVFDEESAKRIASAVKYVEGLQNPEDQPEDETSEQTGRTVIRGTFTGAWAKGTSKSVDFTADNGDAKTKTATNYFADVGAAGTTTDCVIILAGSEWVLVNAEPATECQKVVTSVASAGSLTLISDVSVGAAKVLTSLSGTVVTGVACVGGNLTVTTASLADLAGTSSLSGLVSVSNTTLSLSDLATVTAQNLTLPPQDGCQ